MAITHFFFESRYLQGNTYVDVILPEPCLTTTIHYVR